MNNREIGTKFEQAAAEFLANQGYHIITKNFRCKIGEIDLIADEDGYLCFIEVKYRSSAQNGYPGEAVNSSKIRKITRTAEFYMLSNNIQADTPCRFDVVVILDEEMSLIKNAFDGI